MVQNEVSRDTIDVHRDAHLTFAGIFTLPDMPLAINAKPFVLIL